MKETYFEQSIHKFSDSFIWGGGGSIGVEVVNKHFIDIVLDVFKGYCGHQFFPVI